MLLQQQKEKSLFIIILHFLLILGYATYGVFSNVNFENNQRVFVLTSFVIAIISCYFNFKNRSNYGLKNNFNITTVYLFFYLIINYQFAIEVYFNPRIDAYDYFYKPIYISQIILFSTLALLLFNFGGIISFYNTSVSSINKVKRRVYKTSIIQKLVIISFLLFVVNINSAFIQGGHGTVDADPLAISLYGYYIRFSILYISLTIYNNWDTNNVSFLKYCKLFSVYFLVSVLISIVLFLFAHNRVFIVFLVAPFLFGFLILKRSKISLLRFSIVIFLLLFFSTFFKFFGIEKIFEGIFSESYSQLNFVAFQSLSPFTAEIGGSIYSGSILYSYWHDGGIIFGRSFLVGIIRAFPGGMAIFGEPLGLFPSNYDSAQIATDISQMNYGVGTMSNFDLLINFGYFFALLLMFGIGYFSSKVEKKILVSKFPEIKALIYFLILCSFVLFVPRGSFNDILGSCVFSLMVFNILNLTRSI